jgi:DNA-binding response OmpR family regulator
VGSGVLAGPGESDDDSASGPVPSDRLKADRTAIRILVVEDEWFIAMETEAVLHDGGYSVIGTAATAEDAVAIAGRERPDLVVMDIRLRGDRDGIDAALEIRSRFGVPCIFATAHSEPDVMARGAAAEPLGWLTKPFSGQQLLREVEAAVERLR